MLPGGETVGGGSKVTQDVLKNDNVPTVHSLCLLEMLLSNQGMYEEIR